MQVIKQSLFSVLQVYLSNSITDVNRTSTIMTASNISLYHLAPPPLSQGLKFQQNLLLLLLEDA